MLDFISRVYADPDAEAEWALADGRKPIRTLGYDAPRDRLIAAGFQPIRLVAPALELTPRADAIMGSAEMGPRGRRLLEALLSLDHPEVPVIITQADSDQPQIFAALRELGRLGEPVPHHVHFCDLLHIEREASQRYNNARMAQLDDWLVSLGGERPNAVSLAEAEEQLGRIRFLLVRLNEWRASGLLPASSVLEAIGAATTLPPKVAEDALTRLLTENPIRPTGTKRLFVAGSAQENTALFKAIEACGGLILSASQSWGISLARGQVCPSRVLPPSKLAHRIAREVEELKVDMVLHLTVDGDEAAPWDIAAIKRALPAGVNFAALRCKSVPDETFVKSIGAILAGEPVPAPPARPDPAQVRRKAIALSESLGPDLDR